MGVFIIVVRHTKLSNKINKIRQKEREKELVYNLNFTQLAQRLVLFLPIVYHTL